MPSYKQFSAEFNLSPQEPTEIIVNLKPTTKPSASDLSKIITQAVGTSSSVALSSQLTPATTITNTQYFDNQTWALVTLNLRGGIGLSYFVDHYNAYYGRWVLVAPPNDNFNANTVGTMPTDLQNYINHNYYVER
ncbi:MAG: hypothetical protein ACREGA_02995 [Candidatus Saccharimonadales bacterium]